MDNLTLQRQELNAKYNEIRRQYEANERLQEMHRSRRFRRVLYGLLVVYVLSLSALVWKLFN